MAELRAGLQVDIGLTRDREAFELRSPNPLVGEMKVLSFKGTEAISRLFSFDIVFLSKMDPTALQAALLGQSLTFSIQVLGRPAHVIEGIVAAYQIDGERAIEKLRQYRVRLVPKMWLLRRRKSSRIFQDKSVVDIVSTVLTESGVAFRWDLAKKPPVHAYTVQYQETDYAFVTRLLAEKGLFFYFEPPSAVVDSLTGGLGATIGAAAGMLGDVIGGAVGEATSGAIDALELSEKVVFCDRAAAYPPIKDSLVSELTALTADVGISMLGSAIGGAVGDVVSQLHVAAPTVVFRSRDGMHTDDESVWDFDLRRTVRSKAVYLRDYDFQRPQLDLVAKAAFDPASATELAATATGALSGALEFGPVSMRVNVGAALNEIATMPIAARRLEIYDHHGEYEEQEVAKQHAATHLEQHRARALLGEGKSTCRRLSPGYRFTLDGHSLEIFDREYVVTKIRHEGRIPEASDADLDEVYSNRFECIPAHFAFRPPRPKRDVQQVLESAVVVGPAGEEIYTDEFGRIKVQFHWDREGQKNENSSCWMRVLQAWSGAAWGFQFIPRIGMEVLVSFLGGDEDRPVVTGCVYNRTHPTPFQLPLSKTRSGVRTQSTPGGRGFNELSFEDAAGNELVYLHAQKDLTERVGHDQTTYVTHDLRVDVGSVKHERIGAERHDSVAGNESRAVGGTLSSTIGVDQQQLVGGRRTDVVSGTTTASTKGASLVNHGNQYETIEGYASTTVGTEEKATVLAVIVRGDEVHDATKTITLRAEKGITFECGKSVIRMTPEGIHLETTKLSGKASKSLTMTGDGPTIALTKTADVMAETVNIYSKGGVIELDKDAAKMDGPQVAIACEPDKKELNEDGTKPKTKKFKWKMLDPDLKPYKDKTYTLITQGFKIKATTDGGGTIEQDIPDEAQFAQIVLWAEDYPTGARHHYTIRLGDLPASSSVYGAQLRLKNLGYYMGPESDDTTPELENALRNFQLDHELEATGKLDGKTSGKLDEVHPGA